MCSLKYDVMGIHTICSHDLLPPQVCIHTHNNNTDSLCMTKGSLIKSILVWLLPLPSIQLGKILQLHSAAFITSDLNVLIVQ